MSAFGYQHKQTGLLGSTGRGMLYLLCIGLAYFAITLAKSAASKNEAA